MTEGCHRLVSRALGAWILAGLLAGVRPAIAATCAAPDDATQCTTACSTARACVSCCAAVSGNAVECRRSCLRIRTSRHSARPQPHPASNRPQPHRPTHPSGGPTASGTITASCSLLQASNRVAVTLRVQNSTGAKITNVLPATPTLQIEANTEFVLGARPNPPVYPVVPNGRTVTFLWRGSLSSAGAVGISVSASAADSSGLTLSTPLVDCGTTTRSQRNAGRPAQSRRPLRSPTLSGEAAQCAGCHDNPQMAFVANKWLQSMHANSYGASQGNTFCAQCHAPFQADANATATNNAPIPPEMWQGVTCPSCHPSHDQMTAWGTPIATYDVATGTHTPVALADANQLCMHCHTGLHAAKFEGPGLLMVQTGVRCIDCHMAKVPSGHRNVPDTAAHDFKVAANLPNSCAMFAGGCHSDGTQAWALQEIRSGAIHGSP